MKNDENKHQNIKPTTPVPAGWNDHLDRAHLDDFIPQPHRESLSLLLDNISGKHRDIIEQLQRAVMYFHHERQPNLALPIWLPIKENIQFLVRLIQESSLDAELNQDICQALGECGLALTMVEIVLVDHFVNGTHYWFRELLEVMNLQSLSSFRVWSALNNIPGYQYFNVEIFLPENREWDGLPLFFVGDEKIPRVPNWSEREQGYPR